MLQWMGGSRRKVTTSRGSTQKRQKQYFEQRRRQQTSGLDNHLVEENVCSTSASSTERRSLDVLSLKTLSTVAKECHQRFLNVEGLEAAGIHISGNKPETDAPQRKIVSHSGKPGKDSTEFVSKEESVCDPQCSNERKSCNVNLDPWKNEVSVLDILEDDDIKHDFRENPMSEDHVSFSVGGLGKVRTETPSPPHRMDPHGVSLSSNAFRCVKNSKNPLNDLELEVDAVLQDIDTSLSRKSSMFSSYSSGLVELETHDKKMPEVCFPISGVQFDKYDGRFSGVIHGKRVYEDSEDYKKNSYHAHPNFMVDDFSNDSQRDLPWKDGPRAQRDYVSEDCWESQNLREGSFKRPQHFYERDGEIPIDSFNFADTEFTIFHTPEKSFDFEEVTPRSSTQKMKFGSVGLSRNPNPFCSPAEDIKDSSMSSEESCSSSAVRRDVMDSVAKKSEIFNRLWNPKGHGKCFPSEEMSHGHRNHAQLGKTAVETKADINEFNTSSLPSDKPSRLTIGSKMKRREGWFGERENPKTDVVSGSFYKHSATKSEAYENDTWAEGSISAFADYKLGDRQIFNTDKSRYASYERAPCTPLMESLDSQWKPDLSLQSEVQCIPTSSFGVIESPAIYKPPPSMSVYSRKDQKMEIENPLIDVLDCKSRKQKIDFFAMGIVRIGEEEGFSYQCGRKNLKVPVALQYPELRDTIKSPEAITSEKFLFTENGNENHQKEDPSMSKDAETAVVDHKEPRTVVTKNLASSLDRVLLHKSYSIQFMCVQQAAIEKGKEI